MVFTRTQYQLTMWYSLKGPFNFFSPLSRIQLVSLYEPLHSVTSRVSPRMLDNEDRDVEIFCSNQAKPLNNHAQLYN